MIPPSGLRGQYLQQITDWAQNTWRDGSIGVPYKWGGKDPYDGLDCSGCVTAAGEAVGIWQPGYGLMHNAQSLFDSLYPIGIADLQSGDLAFYGGGVHSIDHVMTVVGDGRVIGATGGGHADVTVAQARADNAKVQFRGQVNYRGDLVGFRQLPTLPTS